MSNPNGDSTIVWPEIKLDHLANMTDSTGIVQHAKYSVPDIRHGYCVDDAGRAVVAVLDYYEACGDTRVLDLGLTYLKYLHYSRMPDGRFQGFMNFARRFITGPDSRDALGRAMWGLAYAAARWPEEGVRKFAIKVLKPCWSAVAMDCPRALAYCSVAAHEYLRVCPGDVHVRRSLERYTTHLAELYESVAGPDWRWFENILVYGNAILPYGMLLASETLQDARLAQIGRDSLDFLVDVTMYGDYLDIVGHNGWYRRGGTRARFDQQPIDAGYMTIALDAAADIFESDRYRTLSRVAAAWFLGRNIIGEPVYDASTGGCRDGLRPIGVNENMGAESTVVCLMALARVGSPTE